MSEDIDYKSLLDDMRDKNLTLEQQVRVWESQWKGYSAHQESHWSISIPKPNLTMGKSWSTIISKIMTTDMEKLYRFYIVVCIICTVVTAISITYKNTRRY